MLDGSGNLSTPILIYIVIRGDIMPSKYNRTLVQEARDDTALKQFKDNKFYAELLDIEKLVKANGLKEVTNPVFFVKSGQPTPDGLLSNTPSDTVVAFNSL